MTAGASVSLTFKGTSVWIYGAKRNDSGKYNVKLDEQRVTVDGFNDVGLFQQVIFSAADLDGTEWHTLSITNLLADSTRPYLDVDSVSILGHNVV